MRAALSRLGSRRRRCLLLAVLALGAVALSSTPALAAPTWGITITHHNAYGFQAAPSAFSTGCPGGAETLEPLCGVDPFSKSGMTFARESGFDQYTIKVKNESPTEQAPSNKVGTPLTCVGGPSSGVKLEYQWLRLSTTAAVPIAGQTGETYTLTSEDEGKLIQCEVTASNGADATVAVSEGALVSPAGGEDVAFPPAGKVKVEVPAGKWVVGETATCGSDEAGTAQWLLNGKPIAGATKKTFKLEAADEGNALQCQLLETSTAGKIAVTSSSSEPVVVGDAEGHASLPAAEAALPAAILEDQLPRGIVLTGQRSGAIQLLPASSSGDWSCQILPGVYTGKEFEGPSAFRCLAKRTLKPGESYASLNATVNVTSKAVNPSINVATVHGSGSEESTKPGESETPIAPAVPFGLHCFAVSFIEESQAAKRPCEEAVGPEPPIAAGGHPFSVRTEFVLNYTPAAYESSSSESPRLVAAGGGEKEILAELPPGVVGNPQNVPECPFLRLQVNKCPPDTAVGYTQTTYDTADVEKGKANLFVTPPTVGPSPEHALVYNVEPSPGVPAEFGFVVLGRVPFVLEAKLRSNGNYGVSVGDSAIAEKVLGNIATFCEYGAEEKSNVNDVCLPAPTSAAANKAPLGTKPFLTSPTQCSPAAPVWTLRADPWNEPAAYSTQTAVTNQLNDCKDLQFHPELDVKPSPASEGGTSQADEPTGMTIKLAVPQTNEPNVKATANLKNLTMTLPEGMTASPSAAHGLEACTDAEFGLGTEFGPGAEARKKHEEEVTGRFVPEPSPKAASCPAGSQIGTAEVFTPLLSGAPAIEGSPPWESDPNERLACSQGMWGGDPTAYGYQWLLNGKAIEGATERVYAFNPTTYKADQGKTVQCQVTATNEGGSSTAVSRGVVVALLGANAPEPATPAPFAPASIAAPTGIPSEGNALTCAAGSWKSKVAPEFEYQWLRNGLPIAGATAGPTPQTSSSYTLTSEDQGKVIQCQVIATNSTGKVMAVSAAVVVSPEASPAPPLPGGALKGQLFVGEPICNPCTETNHDAAEGRIFRLFLQLENESAGVFVKVHGETFVNEGTGQLTSTFVEQPQQPFELLALKLKGGPTATLANPQTCGPATTTSELTPWSAGLGGPSGSEPGSSEEGDFPQAAFDVGGCAQTMPFSPSANAGTIGPNATAAGLSPSFSLTLSREDGEQDLSGVQVHMPLGLVGKIAGVQRCGEAEIHAAEANTGECPAGSKIGTADAGAGPGPDPFFDTGNVYFTGPMTLKNGVHGPFGIVVVTPAVAGPFNLGNVVVRSAINIDPHTAAVTVTSDPLPQFRDGVQLRLRKVNVSVNRPGFMLNPTSCGAQQVGVTLSSAQGATANVATPFGLGGCKSLPFHPTFTATTQGKTSKTEGASLNVKITYPPGAYANIGKSLTELPIALPSRLTTIQKACPDTVFEANPATCPEGSVIGEGTASTPLLEHPLVGPAYLVSHGNRAFPDIEIVLQSEGITVYLDGLTDIKKGITKTTFESLPDSPISSFELNLPEGPHSALAAPHNLCEAAPLLLPTVLTGQNGAEFKQNTNIAVTGCKPTVTISKAKLSGNGLLVTVKSTATGTVKISGRGLKTVTKKNLKAGTYKISVPFTKVGKSLRKHRKKTSVRVSLKTSTQSAAKASTVRL